MLHKLYIVMLKMQKLRECLNGTLPRKETHDLGSFRLDHVLQVLFFDWRFKTSAVAGV
jgi:hypothetical protein